MNAEYNGIEFVVSDTNIHIFKSYLVNNDGVKKQVIDFLFDYVDRLAKYRSKKSMFNEWKAHNILHQHGWWVERTADVDFEFHQKWYHKVGYWLVAHLMREKML